MAFATNPTWVIPRQQLQSSLIPDQSRNHLTFAENWSSNATLADNVCNRLPQRGRPGHCAILLRKLETVGIMYVHVRGGAMLLPDNDLFATLSTLSPALKSVWAKSGPLDDDPFGLWLPLVGHAMDSASVSVHLWDSWLSNSQRALVSEGFRAAPDRDDKYDQARTFVALAAGIHDIGKISKPFARQVSVLAEEMGEHGLRTASSQSDEARDNRWMKHSLAGALAVQSVGSRLGWDRNATSVLASLAGGHHGTPTQKEQLKAARDRRHYLVDGGGDGPWLDAQCEFAAFVQAYVGSPDLARPVDLGTSALVIIQALVMMADWIASSSTYFPLTPRRDRDFGYLRYSGGEHARVGRALTQLRLPPTWTPADSGEDATALLGKKFGVPFAARPLQAAAVIAARQLPGPGMLIIEDAMGAGKTEAALLSAEILAGRFGANGLLIALPTQATTNAMFSRLLDFLGFALGQGETSPGPADTTLTSAASAALLHGRAHWNGVYVDLVRTGRSFLDSTAGEPRIDMGGGSVDVDTPVLQVHPWLRGRHKAILSTFVTTTVDHLLMGALQMKHLAFRHLGLSGKVVIFDEVHASSNFMNFFAERVIEWLGSYGVPVVMLSATLTSELRDRLSMAYQRGVNSTSSAGLDGGARRKRPRRPQRSEFMDGSSVSPRAVDVRLKAIYPRLTTVTRDRTNAVAVAPATKPHEVRIIAHEVDATPGEVTHLLAEPRGGNILVLTNTVTRAQETFSELQDRFGDAVRLVHARFTAADRMRNDQWLLDTYGPKGDRPEFSIVVATQVVEQSLDVDFDVLVTDVAPVDLILQRIGRVHRHSGRQRPTTMKTSVCHLVGIPSFTQPPDLRAPTLDRAARVYGLKPVLDGILALGADVFSDHGRPVTLPAEIGALVEQASTGEFVVPTTWAPAMAGAQDRWDREAAKARAEINRTRLAPPDAELGIHPTLDDWYSPAPGAREDGPARAARARVRDGLEGLDVILVRRIGENLHTMPTSESPKGHFLAEDCAPEPWLAREALLGTVSLPHWAVRDASGGEAVIEFLERSCWGPGWSDAPLLAGELFLELTDDRADLNGFHYHYTPERGLEVTRVK